MGQRENLRNRFYLVENSFDGNVFAMMRQLVNNQLVLQLVMSRGNYLNMISRFPTPIFPSKNPQLLTYLVVNQRRHHYHHPHWHNFNNHNFHSQPPPSQQRHQPKQPRGALQVLPTTCDYYHNCLLIIDHCDDEIARHLLLDASRCDRIVKSGYKQTDVS